MSSLDAFLKSDKPAKEFYETTVSTQFSSIQQSKGYKPKDDDIDLDGEIDIEVDGSIEESKQLLIEKVDIASIVRQGIVDKNVVDHIYSLNEKGLLKILSELQKEIKRYYMYDLKADKNTPLKDAQYTSYKYEEYIIMDRLGLTNKFKW